MRGVTGCKTAVEVQEDALGAVCHGFELDRGAECIKGGDKCVRFCGRHEAADVVNISAVQGRGRACKKGVLHIVENDVGAGHCNRGAHRCAFDLVVDRVVEYAEVVVKYPRQKIEEKIKFLGGKTGEAFAGVADGCQSKLDGDRGVKGRDIGAKYNVVGGDAEVVDITNEVA